MRRTTLVLNGVVVIVVGLPIAYLLISHYLAEASFTYMQELLPGTSRAEVYQGLRAHGLRAYGFCDLKRTDRIDWPTRDDPQPREDCDPSDFKGPPDPYVYVDGVPNPEWTFNLACGTDYFYTLTFDRNDDLVDHVSRRDTVCF